MTYRSLHKANESYKLAVMWLLIGAFLIAMMLMFVHPTGAILVFFLGLIILAVAALIEKLVQWVERITARHELKAHHCPSCGADFRSPPQQHADEWSCDECGSIFLPGGAEQPSPPA